MKFKTLLSAVAILTGSALLGNVSIYVVGQVENDPTGQHKNGDLFEVTFQINLDPAAGTENAFFNGTSNFWGSENYSGGPVIWSDITGPTMSGTYAINQVNDYAPWENIEVLAGTETIVLVADSDVGSIGLSLGAFDVNRIAFSLSLTDAEIEFTTGTVMPVSTYFAGYAGTYTFDNTSYFSVQTSLGPTTINALSMTIVPEPATASLVIGALCGLLLFVRRRLR